MNQSSSLFIFLTIPSKVLQFVQNDESVFNFLFPFSELVDSLGSLDDNFLDDEVFGAGAFDFLDAEVGQLSDTGQEGDKTHEDSHFVVDLLVDIELYLHGYKGTSS